MSDTGVVMVARQIATLNRTHAGCQPGISVR
jgi:hypothetical protein